MPVKKTPSKKTWTLIVEVTRGCDGKLVSAIRREPKVLSREGAPGAVVIDRENGRGPIDSSALRDRAKMLSQLLGIPLREKLKHDCATSGCPRLQKLPCHCHWCHS